MFALLAVVAAGSAVMFWPSDDAERATNKAQEPEVEAPFPGAGWDARPVTPTAADADAGDAGLPPEMLGNRFDPMPATGGSSSGTPPPEISGNWPRQEPLPDGTRIPPYRLDELAYTLRYSTDESEVLQAVGELALYRDPAIIDPLMSTTQHPDRLVRMRTLVNLWRLAADGIAGSQVGAIRMQLDAATYDPDPRVAELAQRAVADLSDLAESRQTQSATPTFDSECPPEDCDSAD